MHPLDNPIWEALTTRQSHFAEGDRLARRFTPEVSALGAISAPTSEGYESLAGLLSDEGVVAVLFDAVPQPPASLRQPDHTGHGYARVLMAAIMKGILERGERPMLHVRAIELYQRIGFKVRRGFEMAVLRRGRN